MSHGNDDERWSAAMAAAMAAAQAGDGAAYAALLAEILPVVRRIAARRWRRSGELEDIVQEALLSLHQVRHTYDPSRPFLPWLTAIVEHRVADALRRHYRRDAREAVLDETHETIAATETNTMEMEGAALRRAMMSLPEGQRRAVELVKLRDLSLAEAARETGVSTGALKVAVHRAIKALKGLLDR